jgi:hypothetical protein
MQASAQTKHEVKTCKKCETTFECKVGDPTRCQCSEVVISSLTSQFLEQTHFDCLCKNCLADLNEKLSLLGNERFPDSKSLREHFHYYMENGLWVFTEHYHILRGYCCQSGCRHCPYGYVKA